jgi:hypothetical protein
MGVDYEVECSWLDFRRALRGLQRNLRTYAREELQDVGQRVLDDAQANAPMRTGQLAASIYLEAYMLGGTAIAIDLKSDLEYAVYMEKGYTQWQTGKKIPGHFFMYDAFMNRQRDFQDALDRAYVRSVLAKSE